jgi:hypothetical protein
MTPPRILALVLPARGGAALADALARLAWADERAVLAIDGARDLPPGVPTVDDPRRLPATSAEWVLVVGEDERLAPDAAGAIRAAVATAGTADVFALPRSVTALELSLRLRGDVVRLARRRTPLVVRPGLEVEFARDGRRRALDVPLVRSRGATLTEAVALVDAEATTLAALLDRRIGRGRGIVWQPVVAAARALLARANRPLGLGRWVLAVLEGYRVVVTYAKLWERRRARVVDALA